MAKTQTAQRTPAGIQTKRGPAPASAPGGAPAAAEIAARAYEIWQESGCPEGSHEEHWYRAEREVRERPKRTA
ncbi:MAG TPA: DUF2934 domain-containing protein [Anaeromyxobacter sp.]